MSQIVLNGDVIDQNKVYPAIIIDGFDKTFSKDKMETNLMVYADGSPEPEDIIINAFFTDISAKIESAEVL